MTPQPIDLKRRKAELAGTRMGEVDARVEAAKQWLLNEGSAVLVQLSLAVLDEGAIDTYGPQLLAHLVEEFSQTAGVMGSLLSDYRRHDMAVGVVGCEYCGAAVGQRCTTKYG